MEMQSVIGRQSVARRRDPLEQRRASRRRPFMSGGPSSGSRREAPRTSGQGGILVLGSSLGAAPTLALPASGARIAAQPRLSFHLGGFRRLSARALAALLELPKSSPRSLILALGLPVALALALFVSTAIALIDPLAPGLSELPSDADFEQSLLEYAAGAAAAEDEAAEAPPPPVSLELTRYRVRAGDALSTIARRFGVSVDSVVSLNAIASARALKAGAELLIPNMSGVVHKVARGESLSVVAKRHGTSVTALLDANDLLSETLSPGQTLFIPGARLPSTELRRVLGELVIWPASGRISSYFGYRPSPFTGIRQFHNGIDIVAPYGSPAKAAMEGRVADVGFNTVYGNYVILAHADGYQTWYAHLSKILVAKGAALNQGATVGLVGNTGVSTGTHLHFSVFKGGKAMNPLTVLKK